MLLSFMDGAVMNTNMLMLLNALIFPFFWVYAWCPHYRKAGKIIALLIIKCQHHEKPKLLWKSLNVWDAKVGSTWLGGV